MATKFQIIVARSVGKSGDTAKLKGHVERFTTLSLKGSRGRGWSGTIGRLKSEPKNQGILYTASVTYEPTQQRASLVTKWPAIVRRFADACEAGPKPPWVVVSPQLPSGDEERVIASPSDRPKSLGEVRLGLGNHFSRIFGRDPHIRLIMDALNLAKSTDWQKRSHVLLSGPPGCGKTDLMRCLRGMLGEENDAWLWLDATSMTRAGVIENLMGADKVPPVLFIEEIEKCDENTLRWLLGVMDIRGEIRRTNYRVGHQARNVHMLVVATANDTKLLRRLMAGALYSRFPVRLHCPRPDRDTMKRILEREIKDIPGGKSEVIEPALSFGFDKLGLTDPRDLVTICLNGGGRLLDGTYQKDYEAAMPVKKKKKPVA